MPCVPTTLLPPGRLQPQDSALSPDRNGGFQGVPSHPGPTLLGMEAWTPAGRPGSGDRREPLLKDTCLKPWLLELVARLASSRRGLCPDPSQPGLPSPSTANTTVCDRTACVPSSPACAAGDHRGHTTPHCHGGSGGHGLSQVLRLTPVRGLHPTVTPWLSPSWVISGSPLTQNGAPHPLNACGCGRPAPALLLGFLVCGCQEGQGCWLSEPVQAGGPEGLRPHAESSHVLATRATHESERAWEL